MAFTVVSYPGLITETHGKYSRKFWAFLKAKYVKLITRSQVPIAIVEEKLPNQYYYEWLVPFGPVREKLHDVHYVGTNNEDRCDVIKIEETDYNPKDFE